MVVAVENSKEVYRQYAKKIRKKIQEKDRKEKKITEKLLNHFKVKNSDNVLVYISMQEEVSTIFLINELLKLGKKIYAPKIVDNVIEFYQLKSLNELVKGKYNIYEPKSNAIYEKNNNSVIIVPGLLFDKNNNRLGYGGGYYDRYLNNNAIYKIGICFSDFLVENLNCESHDIKMDEVITER